MDERPYGREDSKPIEIAEVKMLANRLNQIMARLAIFYIFFYIFEKRDAKNNILSGNIGFKFRYQQRKKCRKAKTITDTLIIILLRLL